MRTKISKPAQKLKTFRHQLGLAVELKPTITDADLSSLLKLPLRTVQRHISTLKTSGAIEVKNKRHLHHAFGWCNERTLKITRSH